MVAVSLLRLAVIISSLPSPLMSAAATPWGSVPVAKDVCGLKVPSPTPKRVLVLLLNRLAVMISINPSELTSPVVIE